ncbi:MAG TPA: hypothetical protein VGM24_12375, partial [Puia sp.]
MKVFKFGGASVSNTERVRRLPDILRSFAKEKLLIVISAMGKTTNALEKVATAFYSGNTEEAVRQFNLIKKDHLEMAGALLSSGSPGGPSRLP